VTWEPLARLVLLATLVSGTRRRVRWFITLSPSVSDSVMAAIPSPTRVRNPIAACQETARRSGSAQSMVIPVARTSMAGIRARMDG
jgi:hypothetical protein